MQQNEYNQELVIDYRDKFISHCKFFQSATNPPTQFSIQLETYLCNVKQVA